MFDGNGNKLADSSIWKEEYHWNLVDQNTLQDGTIDSSGNEIAGPYRYNKRTPFIKVTPNEKLYWMWCSVYGYDENKAFVSKISQTSGVGEVPSNVHYVRITQASPSAFTMNVYRRGYGKYDLAYNSTYDYSHGFPMLQNDTDSIKGFRGWSGVLAWHDKRILTIGDSFSAGGKWQKVMCNNFGAILDNHSISGGGWCTGRTKTVYELAQEVTNTPDIIIIPLATNDINNNAPIGTFVNGTSVDDYSTDTFWGGMQKALTYIKNTWSGVPVYVGTTPANGLNLVDGAANYISAMKECCSRYGCVYIDTTPCGMAYPLIQNDLQYRTSAGDGHPSDLGHTQIGNYMTDLMSGYMANRGA